MTVEPEMSPFAVAAAVVAAKAGTRGAKGHVDARFRGRDDVEDSIPPPRFELHP